MSAPAPADHLPSGDLTAPHQDEAEGTEVQGTSESESGLRRRQWRPTSRGQEVAVVTAVPTAYQWHDFL